MRNREQTSWVEPNVGSPETKPRPLILAPYKSPRTEQWPLSCLRSEGVCWQGRTWGLLQRTGAQMSQWRGQAERGAHYGSMPQSYGREKVEGREEAGSGPPGAGWADVEVGPAVPLPPGVCPAPPLFSQHRQPSPAPPHSQPLGLLGAGAL